MTVPIVHLNTGRLEHLLGKGCAVMVPGAPMVLEVRGSGAVTCLQGLVSNDLVQPGDGSVIYGALLTPKGAIVADLWTLRLADGGWLVGDPAGREAATEILRRSLPPRLARMEDRTGQLTALWLLGERALTALAAVGLPAPDLESRTATHPDVRGPVVVVRPHSQAPFRALVLGPETALTPLVAALTKAGVTAGTGEELEAARILAGWPRLGFEIGERTLPQEVRYDEIHGVSYTKGCYIGQETVARLHFRGHANRELRGLVWTGAHAPANGTVEHDGREVGVIGSLLALDGCTLGLALVRREVEPGTALTAGGQPARVVPLPFDLDTILS